MPVSCALSCVHSSRGTMESEVYFFYSKKKKWAFSLLSASSRPWIKRKMIILVIHSLKSTNSRTDSYTDCLMMLGLMAANAMVTFLHAACPEVQTHVLEHLQTRILPYFLTAESSPAPKGSPRGCSI